MISRLIQGGIAAAVAGGSSWAIVTFRRGRGARVGRRIPDPDRRSGIAKGRCYTGRRPARADIPG